MANFRDIILGALVSGVVTFGTTYYFNEQSRVADAAAVREARLAAEAARVSAARQARVWEYFHRWQSDELIQARDTLVAATRRRAGVNINAWDDGPGASEADSAAMRRLLTFYADLGLAIRAGELDFGLVRRLFGPNVEWWQERALPSLCAGHDGRNDRFNGALFAFHSISPVGPIEACVGVLQRRENWPPVASFTRQ